MFTEERHQQILSYLNKYHRASVPELSQVFQVSESTIRRDLSELEQKEMLRRTHGGAVSVDFVRMEPTVREKQTTNLSEKESIAKTASEWIKEKETILLDSGTTTLQLAKHLHSLNLTIVTNSVSVLTELQDMKNIELLSTGGTVRSQIGAMVGPYAEGFIRRIKVDKLFLGINGVDVRNGLSTPNVLEAQIKKEMISAARQVILLCDHSKLGKITLHQVAPLSEIDVIITDKNASISFLEECDQLGIDVSTV
jgi:DeoR family transcriptional regulator, fructose operon transcriptional repressor